MSSSAKEVTEGTIPVEGTSLHYVTLGKGRPVIVLHGGPGLGHNYLRPGLDRLAERFRLIYYDQRGSGRSEVGDPGKLNLAGTIEDLDAVREAFQIDQANVLGHSIGANIAALYASRHSDHVASLVLASPGPPFDPRQQQELGAEMQRRMTAADQQAMEGIYASDGLRKRDPKSVEVLIRTMYLSFFRDRRSAERINFGFTQISADNVLGAEEAMVGEFAALDMKESLANVSALTLVLRGELEPIPDAFARFIAESIPGAQYELIEGANHFAYIEDPEPFFSPIHRFLEDHAR